MTVSKSLAATLLVAGLGAGHLSAQSLTARTGAAGAPAPAASEYRIGVEDVLDVVVFQNTDLTSRGVQVRPDGRITLPVANDLQAAGLTPMQLRTAIRAALMMGDKFEDPDVSVTVREVNSMHFLVMGKVRNPNRFPLRSALTITDAIAMSGGFADFANRSQVSVLRRDGKTLQFNYDEFEKHPTADANFLLQPDDKVIVR